MRPASTEGMRGDVVSTRGSPFLRILLNYVIIGWLMAFPSYRLGLKPALALFVWGTVTAFGIYHAAVVALAVRKQKR